MKAILTTKEVLEAVPAVNRILDIKPPVKIGFAMQKTVRKLRDVQEVINDMRAALFEKYGKRDDDGELIAPDANTPERKALDEDWKVILGETHEIEVHQIPLSVIEAAVISEKMEPLAVGDYATLYFVFFDDLPEFEAG